MGKEIPTRAEDYSSWYNELVKKADLAEHSDVRGCMVIKPYGYSIWEKMQQGLDKMFKDTGHVNAYFPLVCPKKHVRGGREECGRICQGMCDRDTLPLEDRSTRQGETDGRSGSKAGRRTGGPSNQRGDHLEYL